MYVIKIKKINRRDKNQKKRSTKISYVMKIKNQNRIKKNKSPPKPHSHHKSKSKSKPNNPPFNPLSYLNALIQLTNDSYPLKNKNHKLPQKRDLSSALTIATPAMQNTISTGKIRCKSSISQQRKKSICSNVKNLKQVLNLNLQEYIVTEEQDSSHCIKFTSVSSSHNSHQQTPTAQKDKVELRQIKPQQKITKPLQLLYSDHHHGIDYNLFAKKIQRAWRSFQTYKVINKYYRHFKKQKKHQKHPTQDQRQKKSIQDQRAPQFIPANQNPPLQYHELLSDIPSVTAYLSNYYDFPASQNNNLISAHEELLQRTIKFKIKNNQQPHPSNSVQSCNYLKYQNSDSQNQLNLTQKLNQIQHFIQNQSKKNSNLPDFSETPTIEIKKSPLPQTYRNRQQIISAQKTPQNYDSQENQSTQKKRNQALSINIPNRFQEHSITSDLSDFRLCQQLDHSPTLKEEQFGSSLKREHQNRVESGEKKNSLVDCMIKKETEKYNQILSLIEFCKTDQASNGASNILNDLLKKLEEHKSDLESSKQQAGSEIKMQGSFENEREQRSEREGSQRYMREGSQWESNSFFAFESKDIYNSFEKYDMESESKSRVQNDGVIKIVYRGESVQKTKETWENKQKKEEESYKRVMVEEWGRNERCEMLERFSTLLDLEQQKLTQFITTNQEHSEIELSDHSSQSISQNTESQMEHPLNQSNPSQVNLQQSQNNNNCRKQQQNQNQDDESEIYSFQSSNCSSNGVSKMFQEHMKLVVIKKEKSVKNLMKLADDNKISQEIFANRLQQIQHRFQNSQNQIQQNQLLYIKSLRSVKKQALTFQKDLITSAKHTQSITDSFDEIGSKVKVFGIRKSFSAESMVLKCILKQPLFTAKKTMSKILKRQEPIDLDLLDEDESSSVDESQEKQVNEDEAEKQEKQGKISQKTENKFEEKENEESATKIGHKQNISEDLSDEILNISELLPSQKFDLKSQSMNLDCLQSKQLQKQNQTKGKDFGHANHYAQCDEVWVKVNNKTIVQPQLPGSDSHQNPSIFSTKLSAEKLLDFHSLEDEKSQTQEDMPIEDNPDKTGPLQQSVPQASSPNNSQLAVLSSSLLMQRCSQELEQLIETQLINELLEKIYLNDSMLHLFKPFIEEVFQFTPITDQNISGFLVEQLPNHFHAYPQLVQRANQKINPTSLEILRLVRDFDFEIDQYELILSEDIFKSARKSIEVTYAKKAALRNTLPIVPKIPITNPQVLAKVQTRQTQKKTKVEKYFGYERDMKIMYMKAVFNCLNQFLIEQKSIATHVNTRSTIGTGELSLSIKEFNVKCSQTDVELFFTKSHKRIQEVLRRKCMLPSFKNYKDVALFQRQMLEMIKQELDETEYKWVTYMDEVLEIWNEMANDIVHEMFVEAVCEISLII